MIFITGPLYSGKRTFAQRLPGTRIAEVQALAAEAEDLEKLAEELSAYDIVMATEVGGGARYRFSGFSPYRLSGKNIRH